jgi:ubiquinone/menaquinone biosynthesis C-methylase UbiE
MNMLALSADRIPLAEESFSGNDISRRYDEHAKRYMMPVYRHFARIIARTSLAGCRVLDIGTGSGLLAIELARLPHRDFRLTGIDTSEDMLRVAQENVEQAGFRHRIALKVASASTIPFADGSFDVVVSNASLHHWSNPQAVFNEIKRVISYEGFCLIRDNMRLSPLHTPLIDTFCLLKRMSKESRNLWMRAIRASYTTTEVKAMLAMSGLNGWKVNTNFIFLDFNIEWSPLEMQPETLNPYPDVTSPGK